MNASQARRHLEHDPRERLRAVPPAFDADPLRVTDGERARSRDLQRRHPGVTFGTVGGRHEGHVQLGRNQYTVVEDTRGEVLGKLEAFLAEGGP